MKFKHYFQNEGSDHIYEETFEENITDPEAWVKTTLANFNATLRPHEKFRTTVRVEILDESNDTKHVWMKRTDGMSTQFRGRTADLFFCQKCRITGKRFGLGAKIKIDSKFRRVRKGENIFENCAEALKELAANPDRYDV